MIVFSDSDDMPSLKGYLSECLSMSSVLNLIDKHWSYGLTYDDKPACQSWSVNFISVATKHPKLLLVKLLIGEK